jgi:cell division protein FtsB
MRILSRKTLLLVVLIVLCVFLAVKASATFVRYTALRRELAQVREQIGETQHANERLERQLERMQEPTWLTLLARQRLNYAMPDETVVFVYKSADSAIISQPQQPPPPPAWRQWLAWLVGL